MTTYLSVRQWPHYFAQRFLALLVALAMVGLSACGADDDPLRYRMIEIENAAGEPLLLFAYEGCRVSSVEYIGELVADSAPEQYPDPLVDNSRRRERIVCTYARDTLATLTIHDVLAGGQSRTRTYMAAYTGGRLTALLLTGETPARGGPALDRDLRYYYDARGRVDSITYGERFASAFRYDEDGNITRANYRNNFAGQVTKEFYGYAGESGPNPFLATPVRLLQPYASYWSAQPVEQATFGLRKYAHLIEDGRVVASTELTFGDSTAVQRYVYETTKCQ